MNNAIFTLVAFICPLILFGQKDSSDFYYQKGVGEESGKQYLSAFTYFQKAVNFKADNADAQVALGRTAAELKRFDIAAVAFQKGLSLKKNELGASAQFADISVNQEKFDEAIAYAKNAGMLKSDKDAQYILGKTFSESTYNLSGAAFNPTSDVPAGIPGSSAGIPGSSAGTPNSSAGSSNPSAGVSNLSTHTSNPAASSNLQITTSNINPENLKSAEISYLIGKSFLEKKNYQAAAPFLEQAVMLDTGNAARTYECALNFSAIPDAKKAVKYFLLAMHRGYKADKAYYKNLSDAYRASGFTAEAEDVLKKTDAFKEASE